MFTRRSVGAFTAGALLAAALSITGMQAWQVTAAPGDTDATFVPVDPCRLFDTRNGPFNVGDRAAPLGAGEVFTAQVTGTNGECVGIPTDASAVAFNVTIVNPSAASVLTLFPANLATRPNASNLNWVAGQAPTPNKVDVKLSPDGKIKVANGSGTVDVIADIVGVYTPSSLTELQSRLSNLEAQLAPAGDIDARLDAAEATVATIPDAIKDAQPVTVHYEGPNRAITSRWTDVLSTPAINLTRTGTVLVFASATAVEFEAGADVQCVISNSLAFSVNDNMRWEAAGVADGDQGDASNLAGMESFNVTAGTSGQYRLWCRVLADTDGALIWDPQITVLFVRDR